MTRILLAIGLLLWSALAHAQPNSVRILNPSGVPMGDATTPVVTSGGGGGGGDGKILDGTAAGEADVMGAAPSGTEQGVVTRNIPSGTQAVSATDLDIRNLAKAQDEVYSVLRTDGGTAYDARDRSWTITETVPVSGPLTDTQLRATPVPVSGPLTDAQLRATPVPVSGTVSVVEPVTVDGTVTANQGTAAAEAAPWPTRQQRSATPAVTSVTASASNVTCLASNATRLGATFHNDSTSTMRLKMGATASATSFTVKLFEDSYYRLPAGYTGIVDCIWDSATGAMRVTELTP